MNKALIAGLALLAAQTALAQTTTTSMPMSMPMKGSGTSMNGLNMGSSSMKTPSMSSSMKSGAMKSGSMMNGMGFKKSDMTFVRTATFGNTFEIDAARLALELSKNSDVKAYAQRMIDDHTKLGDAMKAAVMQVDAKYVLPSGLTVTQNRLINNLRRARNFDGVYKADMIKSHDQTYNLFRRYARSGSACKEIKAVVTKYTPTVKSHLDMAFKLPQK